MSGHTYIPPAFRQDDPERLATTVAAHPFAVLTMATGDALNAVHLPFLRFGDIDQPETWRFESHLARVNPVAEALADGRERRAMIVFTGPNAYLSPHWYVDGRATSVPTWNYQAVHARGAVRRMGENDPDWLDRHLQALIDTHQARTGEPPFDYAHLPERQIAAMKAAIVGIELRVDRIEGIEKLSQNKTEADRAGVICGLHGRGDVECDAVADLMRSRGK